MRTKPVVARLLASPDYSAPQFDKADKIPDIYRAHDYVFRPKFEALNAQGTLDEERLRPSYVPPPRLFLQAFAREEKTVYLPYHSRGKLLAAVPPKTWAHIELEGVLGGGGLSLVSVRRPLPAEVLQRLNEVYYRLLKATTWQEYDLDIPFIGVGIWDMEGRDCRRVLRCGRVVRDEGNNSIREAFKLLEGEANAGDRPAFERKLRGFEEQLNSAAAHLGVAWPQSQTSAQGKALWRLCLAFVPKELREVAEAAAELLPEELKFWAPNLGSRLVDPTPLQTLFFDNVQSLKRRAA